MYRLAWLPSWVVSVWSGSPEMVCTKDGAYGTISILQQNGEPSEKKFSTSNILKRLWIIRAAWTWFTARPQVTPEVKKKYCVKRFTKDEGNYKHRPLLSSIKPNNQGCANPRCQVAVATKFCTVTPNLCGSRVNLLHITLLEPRIFWWILNFCCQRPYHVENIGSHPITAVKQRLAWLVPGEVTAWEHQALLARYFLHEVGQLVKSLRY